MELRGLRHAVTIAAATPAAKRNAAHIVFPGLLRLKAPKPIWRRKMKNIVAAAALGAGVFMGTLSAAPAAAQNPASDAARLKMMLECDGIANEATRLACYDQAARRSRGAMGAGKSGMLPGLPAAQPRTPRQEFGLAPKREKAAAGTPAANEITARVASSRDNGIGMWQIAFADGSRWQMTEAVKPFQPPKQGEEVRIRKNQFGGYLMSFRHQPAFRVSRLR
jgi:hypothetical protein